jgi:hypothetical protein
MSLLTIRRATTEDDQALDALAIIDSSLPLSGDVLVAQLDGAVMAAISVTDGRAIADPFRRSADTVEVLRLRARQERRQLTKTGSPSSTVARIGISGISAGSPVNGSPPSTHRSASLPTSIVPFSASAKSCQAPPVV